MYMMHKQRTNQPQVVVCFAELTTQGEKKHHVATDQIPDKVLEIQKQVNALPSRRRKHTMHEKITNVIHATFGHLSRGSHTALARI